MTVPFSLSLSLNGCGYSCSSQSIAQLLKLKKKTKTKTMASTQTKRFEFSNKNPFLFHFMLFFFYFRVPRIQCRDCWVLCQLGSPALLQRAGMSTKFSSLLFLRNGYVGFCWFMYNLFFVNRSLPNSCSATWVLILMTNFLMGSGVFQLFSLNCVSHTWKVWDEKRSDFSFALCWELEILFLIWFLRIMFVKESKFWCYVIDFEFLCFY